MRAAIYARKSTEQNVSADAKSVTRQTELARAFAASKGWTVAGTYEDDGVSGRLRTKLVSRNRMLAAAMAEEFNVLVVRDLDRLSRNDEELPGLIYTLRDAGVEVWCYADGNRVDTRTALARLQLNIRSYSGTAETEKASERTREQKRGRYAKAPNADGKVYGYRNVGEPKQRRREIHPEEAAVIKRIFTMSAAGHGLLRIVKTLNREGLPSPTGRGWCTTGVREMLRRELYRGVSVYGKTAWEWRDGGKFKVNVPAEQWLRVDAPQLRIVDDALWRAVQARQERTRETYPGRRKNGQLQGRRESGLISQYLLAGFLRCGACGGNLIVTTRSGRGGVKRYWICTVAHHRGKDICANVQGIPYEPLTEAVISTFKENFCNPVALGQMLMREFEERAVAPEARKAEVEAVRRDIAKIERETARMVTAVAEGEGDAAPLVEGIRSRERQKADLQAKLEHLDGLELAAESFDIVDWLEEMRDLLANTRDLLEADTAAGRQLLRACLPKPFVVTPDGKGGWNYEGEGVFVAADVDRFIEQRGEEPRRLKCDIIVPPKGKIPVENRRVRGKVGPDPLKLVPPG